MSAPSASLRELFLAKYQDFRKRLRIRLGSEDLANEAMQETWLRVESMPDAAPVGIRRPICSRSRSTSPKTSAVAARACSMEELEELYELADEAAGPVREVEGRQQLAALEAALAELPRRRQAIVIAARVDEVPHREIAERFGISVRTVEKELRAGLEHCCRKLEKSMSNASVPGPANRLRDMAAMFTRKNLQLALRARPRPGCCGWRPGRPQRPMARRSGSGADKASSMRAPSRRPAPPGRRCSRPPGARAPSRCARASQGAGAARLPGGALAACGAYLAFRPPLDLWPAVSELAADYRSGAGEQREVALGGTPPCR